MGALSTWTSWVTIIGLGLALYVIVWPVLRLRATKGVAFRFYSAWWCNPQLPRSGPAWYGSLRRILSRFILAPLQELLTPTHYRISVTGLAELVQTEMGRNAAAGTYEPSLGTDRDLVAITRFVYSKRTRLEVKDLMRCHKGVICAGGCNTEYGKERYKHVHTSRGVGGPAGWICLLVEAGESRECYPKAVGKHLCGTCRVDSYFATTEGDSRSDEAAE